MEVSLKEVIDKINRADEPGGRKQPLPDDALIQKYERITGVAFSADYKIFLKSVSNAFVGSMSPFTLNEPPSEAPGDLIGGIMDAREVGVPEDCIPICEDNGNYYCLAPDGSVRFWDHNRFSDETWPDLAKWANEVWLEGG